MMYENQTFVEIFQQLLEKMETKIFNLQTDLSNMTNERKRIEKKDSFGRNLEDNKKTQTNDNVKQQEEITLIEFESVKSQLKHYQQEQRELLDEIDELRIRINESENKKEEYREKYLNAQTNVEEHKYQLELVEQESSRTQQRINEGLEIANERFNEELQELRHLPFVLQAKQVELQDLQQKLKITEKTVNALSSDLEACIIKYEFLSKELDQEKKNNVAIKNDLSAIHEQVVNREAQYQELVKENSLLHNNLEKMKQLEENLETKIRETNRLTQQINILHEDSARHISRIKERTELQIRNTYVQVTGLEKEIVQLRATLNTALRERDDIRYRMQSEVGKLERKFGEAQSEIKSLKSHIEILRTSYTNLFDNDVDYLHGSAIEVNVESDDDKISLSGIRE